MAMLGNEIIVGLSGGVDSAVTALLLRQQGFSVRAVFMLNWSEVSEGCNWEWDFESAKLVANHLDIPLALWNFEKEYRTNVYEPFIASFARGETPNPDIICNRYVKFGAFLEKARQEGAQWVATGHYASIEAELCGSSRELLSQNDAEVDCVYRLMAGKDKTKDQSYFLATLTQEQLKYALFPLGGLKKEEVRAMARAFHLPNAERKDSYGICFIGEQPMREFLKDRVPHQPGPMITTEGEAVGEHEGLPYYTIGQRKGIGIGGRGPFYVVEKRAGDNALIVAQGENHPALFSSQAFMPNMHWIGGEPSQDSPPRKGEIQRGCRFHCQARHRHLQALQEAVITRNNNGYLVTFTTPQRAVTPGQFLAIYQGEECLGGGVIAASPKS